MEPLRAQADLSLERPAERAAMFTILAVILLAVADAATTLVGYRRGLFTEINPLLMMALQAHENWFLLVKGGLTLFWASVMFHQRQRRWLIGLNAGIAGGYAVIVMRSLWHLAATGL